jgi:iron complex outermembrane receptor protein
MSTSSHFRRCALALSMSLGLPCAADAQADTTRSDTTVFRIEGLKVQAQRPVTTIGGASALEIRVEELGLQAAPTTSELLREVTGVLVRTNSRGQSEISVRGSESRQVAVLVDGVPLTLGYDARTDVSVLPADAFREVHFVRGLSTLLEGPNVLGGVVHMNVARRAGLSDSPTVEASASVDDARGWATSANAAVPFRTAGGRGSVRFGAGLRDSPGLPLPSGVAEPVPTSDGLRLNTDFHNIDGFMAFRYDADGGAWAGLSALTHKADRGIAAELGAAEPRLWRYPDIRRTIVAASAGTGDRTTPFGRGDVEASLGFDDGKTDIRSYTSRAYDQIDGYENGDDRTVSLRTLADHTLGSRGDVMASLTWADIRHDEDVDGELRSFEQKLVSVAAENVWRLVDRPGSGLSALRLSFGGAYDRGTTPLTGGLAALPAIEDWGARVGLSAIVAGGNVMLHAGASRRGRFPALREAYSEALNRFEPNPDLTPEHLFAMEAGVTSRLGEGELQVVGFRHALTDAIRRISLDNGKRMRVNSDELKSVGVELVFSQTMGRVDFGGELTLQSVELTDPNTLVNTHPENVPEQLGSAYLRLPLAAGIAGTVETEYTGSQYCIDPDSGEDVKLSGGTWLNAALSKVWPWSTRSGSTRSVETTISGLNLTGTALYDSCGLPRPGRLLRFQVRVF